MNDADLRRSIVRVVTPDATGTGFVVGSGLALACLHVIGPGNREEPRASVGSVSIGSVSVPVEEVTRPPLRDGRPACDLVLLHAALVSSDDNDLSMSGGVSMALRRAGGDQVIADARKHVPLALNDVAVTTAGRLPARYIFHGVTIDLDRTALPDADCLRQIVLRCLTLADALRLRHIAFPALGTGLGRFPFELAADMMTRTVTEHLSGQPQYLAEVTLALYERTSAASVFYQRAVDLATQWTDSRRLGVLAEISAREDEIRAIKSELLGLGQPPP